MSDVSSNLKSEPQVPWNPWLGLVFIVAVFYGAQFLTSIILSLYPAFRGWSQAQATSWYDGNSILIQFIVILGSTAITLLVLSWFLRSKKLNFGFLGLKKPRWFDPLLGLGVVPAYYLSFGVLVAVVSHFVPSLNVSQKQEIGFDNVTGHAQMIYTFISLVVLAPLLEEIVFRGFIFQTLKKPLKVITAGLITSIIFGAGHLLEGGSAGPLYIGAMQTFVLSLFLVGLRQKTGNLWAGITLHASNNLIAFAALFIFHSS